MGVSAFMRGTSLPRIFLLQRRADLRREVGPLPGEAAVLFRRAPEMAVGRGAGIDRLVEAEMLANSARRKIHDLAERLFQFRLFDFAGSVEIDIDRQRLRNADRVGQLNRAT